MLTRVDLFLLKLGFELAIFFLTSLELLLGELEIHPELVALVVGLNELLVELSDHLLLNAARVYTAGDTCSGCPSTANLLR